MRAVGLIVAFGALLLLSSIAATPYSGTHGGDAVAMGTVLLFGFIFVPPIMMFPKLNALLLVPTGIVFTAIAGGICFAIPKHVFQLHWSMLDIIFLGTYLACFAVGEVVGKMARKTFDFLFN